MYVVPFNSQGGRKACRSDQSAYASTNKCYQWIHAFSRLPSKNPPLANRDTAVKAQTPSCADQEQLNADSFPPPEDVTTAYKPPSEKPSPAQPHTQEPAFSSLRPLHSLQKSKYQQEKTMTYKAEDDKPWCQDVAGCGEQQDELHRSFPGSLFAPCLLLEAESKGRLLGLNKCEKQTPEQRRACQGGYCLLWGREQAVVGLEGQFLQKVSEQSLVNSIRKLWGGDGAQDFILPSPQLHHLYPLSAFTHNAANFGAILRGVPQAPTPQPAEILANSRAWGQFSSTWGKTAE